MEELTFVESRWKIGAKVGGIVLMLISIMSLLMVGVVNHEKPHILHACVSWKGKFTYVSKAEALASGCAQISWKEKTLPLKVYIMSMMKPPFYDPGTVTMEGVAQFNKEAGFEFYSITTEEDEADIVMLYGVPSALRMKNGMGESHVLGTTQHYYNMELKKQQSLINIYDIISHMNILRKVIVHELGHAAGLAHNEDEEDELMYPTIGKLGLRDEPFHINAADRAWLMRRYDGRTHDIQIAGTPDSKD